MRPTQEETRGERQLSFNSRTPGGVRLHVPNAGAPSGVFQFTHPGRGATCDVLNVSLHHLFQFTHPGRGATIASTPSASWLISFNSRTPGGVRRYASLQCYRACVFQFTHPGRGATSPVWYVSLTLASFNSRTPGGVRLGSRAVSLVLSAFQFTHPGRGATSL